MPITSHTKAAEDHQETADAHLAAAALHAKGDHAAAIEKSEKAKGCCCSADKSTADAHKASATKAKS